MLSDCAVFCVVDSFEMADLEGGSGAIHTLYTLIQLSLNLNLSFYMFERNLEKIVLRSHSGTKSLLFYVAIISLFSVATYFIADACGDSLK